MTAEKLHDAIGLLSADLVAETDRRRSGKPKIIPWKRYAALAACFALVLFAGRYGIAVLTPRGGAGVTESAAAMDVPSAAAPMEAAPVAPEADEERKTGSTWLEEPPALEVSSGEGSVLVGVLCLDWQISREDGTSQSMVADAAMPEDTFDSCALLEAEDGQIALAWETMPGSVTFRSWHRDGETVIPDVYEGDSSLLPSGEGVYLLSAAGGTHLYEITAHWPQGWATYSFRVTTD